MQRFFLLISLNLAALCVAATEPASYYSDANAKSGAELKTALHNAIKVHTARTYVQLWTDFQTTDKRDDSTVWDMYSRCTFAFGQNQCGNYSAVCDCYNREHSFPKSWFDDATPMYTDLFHLYPTDGRVNGARGNFPFGEVGTTTWTHANAIGKVGAAKSGLGYSGSVYEPDDEYKGDFARTYFYMVTRYENVVASWFANAEAKPTLDGSAYPAFNEWAKFMLLRWHRQDTVSAKELARNEAVYGIQHNRNPFIDHAELAEFVWGDSVGRPWQYASTVELPHDTAPHDTSTVEPPLWSPTAGATISFAVYPNPTSTTLEIYLDPSIPLLQADLLDMAGVVALSQKGETTTLHLGHIKAGAYLLRVVTGKGIGVRKIIIER
jgi:endonuclease I